MGLLRELGGEAVDEDVVGSAVASLFKRMHEARTERFGNGRAVRNIFEEVVNRQAMRLTARATPATCDELRLLLTEDIPIEGR